MISLQYVICCGSVDMEDFCSEKVKNEENAYVPMGKDFQLVIFRWFKCLVSYEYFLALMQLYLYVPCNIHVWYLKLRY